jgi:sec-independent protein translocase protein TatB
VCSSDLEVNRSIELDELKKMKTQFEDAARNVETSIHQEVSSATSAFESSWKDATAGLTDSDAAAVPYEPPPPSYRHPKKNWRLKRGATPQWYKRRHGVKTHTQSGAARVARFRPPGLK